MTAVHSTRLFARLLRFVQQVTQDKALCVVLAQRANTIQLQQLQQLRA